MERSKGIAQAGTQSLGDGGGGQVDTAIEEGRPVGAISNTGSSSKSESVAVGSEARGESRWRAACARSPMRQAWRCSR
jgi:hypothetical protein